MLLNIFRMYILQSSCISKIKTTKNLQYYTWGFDKSILSFYFLYEFSFITRMYLLKFFLNVGIPEDYIPKLFQHFCCVESHQSHSYEGTGIGFALV